MPARISWYKILKTVCRAIENSFNLIMLIKRRVNRMVLTPHRRSEKSKNHREGCGVARVVEHLPSEHRALSSSPSTENQKE
jgi:hypothetical protein